jgi:hypothetical protein
MRLDDPNDTAFEEFLRDFTLRRPAPLPARRAGRRRGLLVAVAIAAVLMATIAPPGRRTPPPSAMAPRVAARTLTAFTLTRAWMRGPDALDAALDAAATLPDAQRPGGALERIAVIP